MSSALTSNVESWTLSDADSLLGNGVGVAIKVLSYSHAEGVYTGVK